MTHTARLRLTSVDDSQSHNIDLHMSVKELELLHSYITNCDRFAKAKILQNDFPMITNISWNITEGLNFKVSNFDYGEVCELLHLARPIFLAKEPASFEKTQAVFGKQADGTALATHLKNIRTTYERGDYQPYFQIEHNNTPLFHDETLKTWLNGVEYHQDEDKAKRIASLEKALTVETTRGIFVSQLSGRVRATFQLAHLAKLVSAE